MSSTPQDRFDEWWSEDHGDTGILGDGDGDEMVEPDSFDDPESY